MKILSDDVFENAIKSAKISTNSIVSYLKQLRMAKRIFLTSKKNMDNGKTFSTILNDPEKFIKIVKSLMSAKRISLNTARVVTGALTSLFKHLYSSGSLDMTKETEKLHAVWVEYLKEFQHEVLKIQESNKMSEREKASWVEYSDWEKKEKELREEEEGSLTHLLIAFHALLTPLRGGDYASIEIVPSTDRAANVNSNAGGNVLVWDGVDRPSKILIRNHKTRSKYPVLIRELPQVLKKSIAVSLKERPRSYLFTDFQNNPWNSRDAFIKWKARTFEEVFGKPTSTNIARHAYVTASRSLEDSVADEKKRADSMGHGLGRHYEYRKIKDS
jgi:hypothetical protein